jgi:hypothetical protein
VPTSELHAAWRRTEAYLREARAELSQAAEGIYADEIAEAEGFLEHNELGLAFEVLNDITVGNAHESPRVLELLALAAASMGLNEQQRAIDAELTKLRGWNYETRLPTNDA